MKLIIVAALIFAGMYFAEEHANAAAPAQDGYVTYFEFTHMTTGSMSVVEHELGVVDRGHVVHTAKHGKQVLKQYPFCGQAEGFVQVSYVRRGNRYLATFASLFMYPPSEFEHQPETRTC